jgi:uncharacterized OB-fold protein
VNEEKLSQRPSPVPDEQSQPFFDAASRSELLVRVCSACGAFAWPVPRYDTCQVCWTHGLEWTAVSGLGVIHSVTRVHSVPKDDDPAWAPFVVGVVELHEGIRTQIVGLLPADDGHIDVGDPVKVVFHPTRDGVNVPWFMVTTASTTAPEA